MGCVPIFRGEPLLKFRTIKDIVEFSKQLFNGWKLRYTIRPEFCYELPTMNEQIPVRFNLRKSRTGLLFAEHDREEDYETFLRRFTKTLDSVSRGSKQILYFSDGEMRKNRFAAQRLV